MPWSSAARTIIEPVSAALGIDPYAGEAAARETRARDAAANETAEWAACGAMALTGRADGPPLCTAGSPASTVRDLLQISGQCLDAAIPGQHAAMPGSQVLAERAALTGLARRGPWSAGGAFRPMRARDGWFGVSLARAADVDLLPALMEQDYEGDPWHALEHWLRATSVTAAARRAALLGLPAAPVPAEPPTGDRPPVRVQLGGHRAEPGGRRVQLGGRRRDRLLVVDLTSLWAGPLCAHLLGLSEARVIKVETVQRPDGARCGSQAFFDLLHAGHESLSLDPGTDLGLLVALLRRADIVLEASRPRALRQWGIDAASFVADGAIWVSITAYGRDDEAGRVGFGDDVAAGAGLVAWDDGEPLPAADAIADPLAGAAAAAAAGIALTGDRGCLLDVSMHHVAAAAAAPPASSCAAATAAVAPGAVVRGGASRTGDSRDGTVLAAGPIQIAEPKARLPLGRAPALGAHNTAIRAELG